MTDNESTVVWGTVRAWSRKLGIAEEVLRARCAGLPTHHTQGDDPAEPQKEAESYSLPDVLRACSDLLPRPGQI